MNIEKAANAWLDLTNQKQAGPLSDADEEQLEKCRRFLAKKKNPRPVPGEDFADVVLYLRKAAILRRMMSSMRRGRVE